MHGLYRSFLGFGGGGVNLFLGGGDLTLVLADKAPAQVNISMDGALCVHTFSLVIPVISAAPFVYPHTWAAKVRATRHNCKLSD